MTDPMDGTLDRLVLALRQAQDLCGAPEPSEQLLQFGAAFATVLGLLADESVDWAIARHEQETGHRDCRNVYAVHQLQTREEQRLRANRLLQSLMLQLEDPEFVGGLALLLNLNSAQSSGNVWFVTERGQLDRHVEIWPDETVELTEEPGP